MLQCRSGYRRNNGDGFWSRRTIDRDALVVRVKELVAESERRPSVIGCDFGDAGWADRLQPQDFDASTADATTPVDAQDVSEKAGKTAQVEE